MGGPQVVSPSGSYLICVRVLGPQKYYIQARIPSAHTKQFIHTRQSLLRLAFVQYRVP